MSRGLLSLITIGNYVLFGLVLMGIVSIAVTVPMMFASANSSQSGSFLGVFYILLGLYPITYLVSVFWSIYLRVNRVTPGMVIGISLLPAAHIAIIAMVLFLIVRSL